MNYLYQKVSYLKGLSEGLGIEESSKEGKLLLNMLETLEDFADAMNEINDKIDDVDEYVDFMDEDLADVEEEVFGFFDDDDLYDGDFFDEDFDTIDIECPECCESEDLLGDKE